MMQRRKPLTRRKPLVAHSQLQRQACVRKPRSRNAKLHPHHSDACVPAAARGDAFARDSYDGQPMCMLTGWPPQRPLACMPPLDPHHRMLKGMGGTGASERDILPRLITICRTHHDWVHGARNRRPAEQAGLIVRRGNPATLMTRLTTTPVRYALSSTGWALLTADGDAVPCPPPERTIAA